MARFTETNQDVQHIASINKEMPIGGIVELELVDGTLIEGVLRTTKVGNNGGEGRWKYYGEIEIETKENYKRVIDYLDIKWARNAWTAEKAKEYEELGLITIVDI